MKIHYAGSVGGAFGWGICGQYLTRELGKLAELTDASSADVVFMPLADHGFNPISDARGKINLAYTFFEFPLGPNAAANAAKYDTVFVGSTWCKERLAEIGIRNTEVLIQGVDFEIFKPLDLKRTDKEFRIFSGGKFEFRKGQDLVLAAFKLLHEKYPEMRLVTAWHNLWPTLINSMRQSPYIKMPDVDVTAHSWEKLLGMILTENDIPKEKVLLLPAPTSQGGMAFVMNRTDVGVFPNRCEGGTNLVLMEYAACGKPVCANRGTGHEDVVLPSSQNIDADTDPNLKWAMSPPEWVKNSIEEAYGAGGIGMRFKNDVSRYTWPRMAQQIIDHIEAINANGTAKLA